MAKMGRPCSWTQGEMTYLEAAAKRQRPYVLIARDLRKHESAVRWHIKQRGLPCVPIRRRWTPEEVERFKQLAGVLHPAEIGEELGRTEQAIRVKANELRVSISRGVANSRPWTQQEIMKLYALVDRMGLHGAARILNRTYRSVTSACKRYNIRWTQGKRSLQQVADEVGVCTNTIRARARALGLQIRKPGNNHCDVNDEQYDALLADFKENPPIC